MPRDAPPSLNGAIVNQAGNLKNGGNGYRKRLSSLCHFSRILLPVYVPLRFIAVRFAADFRVTSSNEKYKLLEYAAVQ